MKGRTFTAAQKGAFWRAFSAACQNLGYRETAARDEYRHAVMLEETGKRHLAELDRTNDYDKVMARFAADAADYQAAAKFAVGDVYRLAVMIKICCAQIMQLRGDPVGAVAGRNYLAGILNQAHIRHGEGDAADSFWMDVAQDTVLAVFQMLDTHRRRLLRPFLASVTGGSFLGFDPSARYVPQPGGGIRILMAANSYREFEGVRVNICQGGAA